MPTAVKIPGVIPNFYRAALYARGHMAKVSVCLSVYPSEVEKQKRSDLRRKYKKGITAVNAVDYLLATSIMGLSVVGVGLLATIIAAPAVITTETVTIGAGTLFVLNRQLNKKTGVES